MPSERELLEICLRWIQNPHGDAFDRAMLVEEIKRKLRPESELRSFLARLLDPEDLGHAVSAEVRQKVSVLLKRNDS